MRTCACKLSSVLPTKKLPNRGASTSETAAQGSQVAQFPLVHWNYIDRDWVSKPRRQLFARGSRVKSSPIPRFSCGVGNTDWALLYQYSVKSWGKYPNKPDDIILIYWVTGAATMDFCSLHKDSNRNWSILFVPFSLPLQKLKVLYSKIGAALQLIPKEAAYRQYTEQIVNDKLAIVNQVSLAFQLEIGLGSKFYFN